MNTILLDYSKADFSEGSLPPLYVTYITWRGVWVTLDDYAISVNGIDIVVPAQFEFDLSSIPRVVWPLVAPNELSLVAPACHDLLYAQAGMPQWTAQGVTRKVADGVFLALMAKERVPRWRRSAAYMAVRSPIGALFWHRDLVNNGQA